MIIQLSKLISGNELTIIANKMKELGYKATEVTTGNGHYLVCIGSKEFDIRNIGRLKGVIDIHRVSDSYKLVSKKWKVHRTQIDLGDGVFIKPNAFCIAAGPCSIENETQVKAVVEELKKQKVSIMRGGVYKPRSSPYSFRGLGIEGLKMFHSYCQPAGIKIISEVMQVSQIEPMMPYVDIFQVGTRNAQNFNLLDALGEQDKAVMLKRGMSGSIEELLQAAEYVFSAGNERIILCERGIRTYENAYRNTLDLNAVSILKEKTHLPIWADPSHGIGIRKHVPSMALAALMSGADGIIMEIHPKPEEAFSDGAQTMNFPEFEQLMTKINKLKELDLIS